MSAPPSIRQITREAVSGAPDWVDKLLTPLNTALTQIQDLFTHNITIGENLAAAWVDITFTAGQTIPPLAVDLRGRPPRGVTVQRTAALGTGSTPGTPPGSSVGVEWAPTTVGGKPGIQITTVHGGLTNGERYTLTLLVQAD